MRPCGFPGCDRPLYRAGLCHGHRSQKRNGLTLRPLRSSNPVERFWKRTEKGDGCWVFRSRCDESGYATVKWQGKMRKAHRVSWEMAFGPIPEGRQVLHHCDNPPCVRPDHLFLGNNDANVEDKVAKDRQARHERSKAHKLTESQVEEMRRRWQAHEPAESLAHVFGVCVEHVRRICRRLYWKGPVVKPRRLVPPLPAALG